MSVNRIVGVLLVYFTGEILCLDNEGDLGNIQPQKMLLNGSVKSLTGSVATYSSYHEEDETPRLDYKNPQWCHPLTMANGEVTCFSPRGGNYRSSLGTRCEVSCNRGYRLLGKTFVHCLASRRWSGTAHCRQVRCRVLPLIFHGRHTCSQSLLVDSRCDYTCDPGYSIEGDRSRTCQLWGTWSGTEPVCSDYDPPKIKCPPSRVKVADPGELTATVTWEPPVATDTADKSLDVILVDQAPDTPFNEGVYIIRYKVYDQARNRAGCKFFVRVEVRRCPELIAPLHGYLTCTSDGNNYGAVCEYHCNIGFERTGPSSRVCQLDRSWSESPTECIPLAFNADVNTASALLDQFYEKRRLLIVSAPDIADQDYKMQNNMLQKSECGLDLRQVTVIEVLGSSPQETGRIKERQLSSEVIEELRQAFRISRSYFSMVLLDEYGVDRERFITTVSSEEIFSYIDDFLLDEDARERLELHRDYCD